MARGWRFGLDGERKISQLSTSSGATSSNGKRLTSFPLSVNCRECHESANQHGQVGQWEQQAPPIDVKHVSVGMRCGVRLCRRVSMGNRLFKRTPKKKCASYQYDDCGACTKKSSEKVNVAAVVTLFFLGVARERQCANLRGRYSFYRSKEQLA